MQDGEGWTIISDQQKVSHILQLDSKTKSLLLSNVTDEPSFVYRDWWTPYKRFSQALSTDNVLDIFSQIGGRNTKVRS